MTPTRISAKDWLASKGKDFLSRAYDMYACGEFTRLADQAVAGKLNVVSALDGVQVKITPDSCCKARCSFGLVKRKGSREAKASRAQDPARAEPVTPQQAELPIAAPDLHHRGDPLWAMVGQLKILNGHLDHLRGVVALSHPPFPKPEPKSEFPKAVNE